MIFFDIGVVACSLMGMLKFKSILVKIILLILLYPLLVLILFRYDVPLYGLLEIKRDSFSNTAVEYAYYAYVLGMMSVFAILWPMKNKLFQYAVFPIRKDFRILLFCCLILSSLWVLNIHDENALFKSGTPYIVFNMILLLGKKHFYSISTIVHLLILTIIIILGERVESILVIVILFIMNGNMIMNEVYNKKYLYSIFCGLFILASLSAFWRSNTAYSIYSLMNGIYAQPTICDVLYVYLCSSEYYIQNGVNIIFTGNTILGLFPGVFYSTHSPYRYRNFLNDHFMYNAGGGLFFSEGMLAFGPIGVVIYLSLIAYIVKFVFNKVSKTIYSAIFILLFIQMCRLVWYGIIFIYKPLVLTIISVIGLQKIFKSKKNLHQL
jgi:hypothetical protein